MRALISLALIAAAGATALGTAGPAAGVTALGTAAPAAAAAPARCAAHGPSVSELTGLRAPTGPLVAVKVNNMTHRAWPHVGLESADMNFVVEIENGYTRHIALFASRYPSRVGSTRSIRETDLELLPSFGKPGLVGSGEDKAVRRLYSRASVVPMREATVPAGFLRDAQVGRVKGATHNLYAKLPTLRTVASQGGATKTSRQAFCFGPALGGGRAVDAVEVRWPKQGVRTTWNARTGRYDVTYTYASRGKRVLVPALSNRQRLSATNVVVLASSHTIVRDAYHGSANATVVPKSSTLGTGQALVMRKGVAHRARWSRPTLSSPLTLLATDGKPMPLSPGNTWVLVATQQRQLAIKPAGLSESGHVIETGRRIPAGVMSLVPTSRPAVAAPRVAYATIGRGTRGSNVTWVQRRLRVQPTSGYFGVKTEAAVKRFQAGRRLHATGVVDAVTWRALGRR